MSLGIIIAIDGYSSCGKSTLATDLANRLGYIHIDSGAMYRAVTLYLLEQHIPVTDTDRIVQALDDIEISFEHRYGHQSTILNGVNVDTRIREQEVNKLVSPVAAISAVRKFLVAKQRLLGKAGGIVMDGRDIGTVVFPNAELKIFLVADKETRVRRRYDELIRSGVQVTLDDVRESLEYRDHIDTTRADSPLRQADDAIVIDNTHLDREEQLRVALDLARERIINAVGSSPPQ